MNDHQATKKLAAARYDLWESKHVSSRVLRRQARRVAARARRRRGRTMIREELGATS